ncbi:MAG: ATP-binding cassette domain-containing protein [Magnetovibrio sp.]|nr:ATP-binding cassette domain-containing protein [Magnetovibrio sp.]
MAEENLSTEEEAKRRASGYHMGAVETVISVDDVNRQARTMKTSISLDQIGALANNEPYVAIEHLNAGYGKMEILHDFNLQVAKGQSLCLIGPNGAGKSTILHSIFGFSVTGSDDELILYSAAPPSATMGRISMV